MLEKRIQRLRLHALALVLVLDIPVVPSPQILRDKMKTPLNLNLAPKATMTTRIRLTIMNLSARLKACTLSLFP